MSPDPNAWLDNMRKPMPLSRKLRLFGRNQWSKLRKREACCGHPGEPGC